MINKHYNPNADGLLVYDTSGAHSSQLKITSLAVLVQYSCTVKALLSIGYGQTSEVLNFWTKPQSKFFLTIAMLIECLAISHDELMCIFLIRVCSKIIVYLLFRVCSNIIVYLLFMCRSSVLSYT